MIYTIAEAKERNREAGFHWFSAENMSFFGTRLPKSVLPVDNGALFVSSEQHPWPMSAQSGVGLGRRYSVRFIHDSGAVATIGEFQQYAGRESATRKAEKLQLVWPSYFASDARLLEQFGPIDATRVV